MLSKVEFFLNIVVNASIDYSLFFLLYNINLVIALNTESQQHKFIDDFVNIRLQI